MVLPLPGVTTQQAEQCGTAPMNPCRRAIPASQGDFLDRDVHEKISKDPDEAPCPWVRAQMAVLHDSTHDGATPPL